MKRIRLRRLVVIVAVITVAMVAGETLIESLGASETIRSIERHLSSATGYDVRMGSDFHLEVLPILRFEANDVRAGDPDRPVPPVLKVQTLRLQLNPWRLLSGVLEIDELDLIGPELHLEAAAHGAANVESHRAPAEKSTAKDIDFRIRRVGIEDLRVSYPGEAGAPVRVIEIPSASLEAETPDGPVEVEVDGQLEGEDFELTGQVGPIAQLFNPVVPYPVSLRGEMRKRALVLSGTLADPVRLEGVDLHVRLDSSDLSLLRRFVPWSLPAIDSVHLDARLTDGDGSLGIDGKIHIAARHGEISGDVRGKWGDLARIDDVELALSLSAGDLREIGASLVPELALPDVGPVAASATIRSSANALRADAVTLKIGSRAATWLEAGGSVANLESFTGVRLSGEFAGADLRYANPYLDHELPDLGPVAGSIRLSDRDGSLGIEQMQITGGRKGALTFDITGRIDALQERDEIGVEAKLEARDLALIGEVVGVDLPSIGPVSFIGTVSGSNEKIASHGSTRFHDSVLFGDWSGSFAGSARPKIRARLRTRHLRLDDLGISPEGAKNAADADQTRATSAWSSHDPLPFEWLQAVDADLAFEADRVTGAAGFELDRVRLAARLEDGRLEIPEFTVGFESGTVQMHAQIDASGSVSALALKVDAEDVHLTPLLVQVRQIVEEAGMLSASIDVHTRGNHPAELRSNLAGNVRFVARDGRLAGHYASAFATNFAVLAVPSILTGRTPRFGCIVADFGIEDGVATARELLLESEKVSVVGAGTVDIGADAFDLTLIPKVHEPGLVSLAAAVKVTGPLADPVFSPQYASMPLQAVRGFVSNLLAPGTALIKPFRKSRRPGPCDELRPLTPSQP
jgi:uncharacterized protein involved in outer membrane biogenesis